MEFECTVNCPRAINTLLRDNGRLLCPIVFLDCSQLKTNKRERDSMKKFFGFAFVLALFSVSAVPGFAATTSCTVLYTRYVHCR